MTGKHQFCAECGKMNVPLHENFCQNCYWKYNKIASPNKTKIEVPYCMDCNSLKLPLGWSASNSLEEIPNLVASAFEKLLYTSVDAIINNIEYEPINWINPNPEFKVKYLISIQSIPKFDIQEQEYFLLFKFLRGICKICVRRKTGSGDITVQFRVRNRHINTNEKDLVVKAAIELSNQFSYERPDSYFHIKESHSGLDFSFGNTMIADAIIEFLKDNWIGIYKKNYKLITEDKEGNRIYSITHLYRIPEFVYGDIIIYNGELHHVNHVSKYGIHIKSLFDMKKNVIKEWQELIIVNPLIVKKMVLSEDIVNSSYLIMDMIDYSTEEIDRNRFTYKLPISQEITFIFWEGKYYYSPELIPMKI